MNLIGLIFLAHTAFASSYADLFLGELYSPSGGRITVDEKLDIGITSNVYLGGRISNGSTYAGFGVTLDDAGVYGLVGLESKWSWFRLFVDAYNSSTLGGRNEAQVYFGMGISFWDQKILGQ